VPNLYHQQRGFFGVLKVTEERGTFERSKAVFASNDDGIQRKLIHGNTTHGVQFLGEAYKRMPTSYYGRVTGVGLTLNSRAEGESTRLGVIGLGVGTLATYGRPSDFMRFYEIDPAVIRIARESGDFSFLRDSRAEIEVVAGDGRVALAEEQRRGEPQDFDVLILDAFTSDAIPVHLLTRESFEHYAAALAPNGLLLVHVSNRHFAFYPLVARMGQEVGFDSIGVETQPAVLRQSEHTVWVMLARDRRQLRTLKRRIKRLNREMGLPEAALAFRESWHSDMADVPVWTDDYSDLFSFLSLGW
jgi:spermidine synthase